MNKFLKEARLTSFIIFLCIVILFSFSYMQQGQAAGKSPPAKEQDDVTLEQRRDNKMKPEDPRVIEWFKVIQDISSEEQALMPSMEGNRAQTFNNALSSMVFILKDEKERAQRILDFYQKATVVDNQDKTLQNFFYKGQPRGFYQTVLLNKQGTIGKYHEPGGADRWIGDMAWLLLAYKYYEKEYNSKRYEEITKLLKELILSYYKQAEIGGYIQHGWRNSDSKLHEETGHHEANIDCYAVLKICGEDKIAENIKKWIGNELKNNKSLPLDLYTWRTLAFGPEYKKLLDIPEYDLGYRKTLKIKGKKVTGFYHSSAVEINNIWIDGLGHMACGYFYTQREEKGNFYSNQMDTLLIERNINGIKTKSIPYTVNEQGGFSWVDFNKGFTSTAAWYIIAKNKFNPLTLTFSKENKKTAEINNE